MLKGVTYTYSVTVYGVILGREKKRVTVKHCLLKCYIFFFF